jgi:hypothetical protein
MEAGLSMEEEIIRLLCDTPCRPDSDEFVCSENLVAYCPKGGTERPALLVKRLDQEGRLARVVFFDKEVEVELYSAGEFVVPQERVALPLVKAGAGNLIFVDDLAACGTAGARVKDVRGLEYILSARHVLAPSSTSSQEVRSCAGRMDVVGVVEAPPKLKVGCGSRFINDHEGAIAKLTDLNKLVFSSHSGRSTSVKKGDVIIRPDAKSMENSGTVFDVDCYIKVAPDDAIFRGQIIVEDLVGAFCSGGDSGSLLVRADPLGARDPVGLLSWRSLPALNKKSYSVATPIDKVLFELGRNGQPLEL